MTTKTKVMGPPPKDGKWYQIVSGARENRVRWDEDEDNFVNDKDYAYLVFLDESIKYHFIKEEK